MGPDGLAAPAGSLANLSLRLVNHRRASLTDQPTIL